MSIRYTDTAECHASEWVRGFVPGQLPWREWCEGVRPGSTDFHGAVESLGVKRAAQMMREEAGE